MRQSTVGIILLSIVFFISRFEGVFSQEPLQVFIVPHSHDDVGWIITMNQYFDNEVQYIYDTVVRNLMEDPNRRFSIVEVGFLKKWWEQATETQRNNLVYLHDNGQVEFLIGGIVMNDEAAATYEAVINNMQEGHRFLFEHFKAFPKIGWQVDPFGSSKGTPTIHAWDCFDAFITSRINYLWKETMQNNQSLEFVWKGTNNLGEETNIFTHVMDEYSYCNPYPFAFGNSYNIYDPPNPNPPITELNIATQAQALVDNIMQRSAWFATNNLLWPFGCDFNYQNADQMFKNMDKLIHYINANASFNMKLKYSHVQDYFDAVHNANLVWREYTGDFFPYNDNSDSYWTGYFSSRNALKQASRQSDTILRTAEITSVLTEASGLPFNLTTSFPKLEKLRFESAVSQHHDGISGTARPNVIKDYVFRLMQGNAQCANQTGEMIQQLATNSATPTLTEDPIIINEAFAFNKTLSVVAYNNLPWNRTEFVSLIIPSGMLLNVTNHIGEPISAQIDPIAETEDAEILYFEAKVPGLGFSTFFITADDVGNAVRSQRIESPASATISNQNLILNFQNGELSSAKSNLGTVVLTNQIMQYTESDSLVQPGGAYIFRNRENKPAVDILSDTVNPSFSYYQIIGPYVQSFGQIFHYDVHFNADHLQDPCRIYDREQDTVTTNTTQVFRLYSNANAQYMELDYAVGPVTGDRDIITRFSTPNITGVQNANLFYQDDSGFQTMQRTFNASQNLLIPGNYYPIVNSAYIEDTNSNIRLTTLTSHAHGGASLSPGQMEIVLHRRTLQDDNRGVSCPLNDLTRLAYKHRVTLNTTSASEQMRQKERLQLNYPLSLLFGTTENQMSWASTYHTEYAPMTENFPPNLHLLSLLFYDGNNDKVILRLQHLFESGSDSTLAVPVTIDINTIFKDLTFSNIVQLSISANQDYAECSASRWKWETESSLLSNSKRPKLHKNRAASEITVYPGQIKTFSALLTRN